MLKLAEIAVAMVVGSVSDERRFIKMNVLHGDRVGG